MFYYLLGNVRPKFHSQLKVIQLVAVVKASVIESNGIDAIVKPVAEDIKKLEKASFESVDIKLLIVTVKFWYIVAYELCKLTLKSKTIIY